MGAGPAPGLSDLRPAQSEGAGQVELRARGHIFWAGLSHGAETRGRSYIRGGNWGGVCDAGRCLVTGRRLGEELYWGWGLGRSLRYGEGIKGVATPRGWSFVRGGAGLPGGLPKLGLRAAVGAPALPAAKRLFPASLARARPPSR